MLKRTITAIVAILILIPICIFSGTFVFNIAAAVVCTIGVYEMLKCLGALKEWAISIPSYLLSFFAPLTVRFFSTDSQFILSYAAAAFLFLVYLLMVGVLYKGKYRVEHFTIVFATVIYVITSFVSIVMVRDLENGQYLYLLIFIGPWISDTFAYLTGRFFGKHKLIEEISPKKTIEGSIGGVVFCAISLVVYGFIVSRIGGITPRYVELAVLGIIVSAISQMGDLIASYIKRQYNIKDYGFIFPGHGGVMDRFDSILITAPILLMLCAFPNYFNLFV